MKLADEEKGVCAVHCLAGLGRTGTLIALWIMNKYDFTAPEVIAYLRILRPGSIIGPQQQYLCHAHARLKMKAPPKASSAGAGMLVRQSEEMLTGISSVEHVDSVALAQEVKDGMLRRHRMYRPDTDLELPNNSVVARSGTPVGRGGRPGRR